MIAGLVPPDDAAQKVTGRDGGHRLAGLPDEEEPEALVTLTWGLGRLRALGVRGLRIALPVAGHPLGLTGPAGFNELALDAGEAVLTVGGPPLGLVPEVTEIGSGDERSTAVVWRCLPVREAPPADVPSLSEAERELNEALRDATEVLTQLDVAGSGPGAQAALDAYRTRRTRSVLAPGYPPRAVRVLELAQRVGALVDIAAGRHSGGEGMEHGGAVSASQIAARAGALRPLERTARRAQVAAYNAFVDQPDTPEKAWRR
ncbi:hypothetical protein GCM10012280_04600 [Wenjunlia tyrosinilytica]|uniref:Uncharacterized protein n=1 Tax=Wenjunlia tyrosinilytica TaxID=1544741 RepID=A0A917ZFM8_9ACTN|nr:hypothetical protein GCM10012280_04600 [Wenjunlia tyrosinilytica]